MTKYDSDTTVIAVRVLEFFRQIVFDRKVRKIVDPNAGYSGQVGLLARLSSSATVPSSSAESVPSIPTTVATTATIVSAAQASDADLEQDLGDLEESDETQDCNLEDEAGSEDEAEDLTDAQQEEVASQLVQSLESTYITNVTEKNNGEALSKNQGNDSSNSAMAVSFPSKV